MLNLFKLNSREISEKTKVDVKKKTYKHFPSSIREWNNSIYVYNKNALNLIPSTTTLVIKIIKSYFSLFNKNLERKMRTKRLLLRFRRLSSNKIYVSTGEFKHTNNKVIITLYLFNRQKYNYLLTIKNWYLKSFLLSKKTNKRNFNKILIKRLRLINKKGIQALKKANKNKYYLIKALDIKNNKIKTNKSLSQYTGNFYKRLLKKSFRKLQLYLYYKQLVLINNSKLNYTYLQYLKKHLESIYNKNVEFNLINLKRFYLNSEILSESITLKLRRNRRKLLKYLNNIKNKVKIQKKKIFLGKSLLVKQNLDIKENLNDNKALLNNIKYRHVTGFRLEARGRLTRRYTASRSISKVRYKGNLLDIDSSYRGLSSVLLKGNLKSNVQFTKLSSKTRIGSFGIKGWISGN